MKNEIEKLKIENKGKTNYLTHNFHTYPAKYIPQIPKYFIEKYTKEGDWIYEPFLGCGTTLVECKLLNRNGIGIDSNPIATLVSKSKTQKLSQIELELISNFILDLEVINSTKDENFYDFNSSLNVTNFDNKDHWFQKNVQIEISYIKNLIKKINKNSIQDFLNVCLSSIIVEVSNQESDTRYASKNKNISNFKTIEIFLKKAKMMIDRISTYSVVSSNSTIEIYTQSSESVSFIKNESIDLVVTSPPYANTYDYYLYHKSRMNWLDYDFKSVQQVEIGSRDKHSSKKLEIDNFLSSLDKCFGEVSRVLKKGKYAVIVIGDSVIRGEFYNAMDFTEKIFNKYKMKLVESSSTNLKETTRMFNPKFTNALKSEHILIFKK
jgi:site-specific DNA-methyltransferase (cytosine-N4-specific)